MCYNRFRYYHPETGRYISEDPIKLLGGFNVFAYVGDTNAWLDLLGLNRSKYGKNRAKWKKNNYNKDGNIEAIDHIMKQHSFHKAPEGKGKFRENLNTKEKIQDIVNQTVQPENLVKTDSDGTRTYVKTFDHSIGTNREGKSTNKVQVNTDSNGWVRTGYPI